MTPTKTHRRKPAMSGLSDKRERMQKLVREYNALAREYNELSKKSWQTAQKRTAAGEAAAKRLVQKYNQLAQKGKALERAATAYNLTKSRKKR